MDSGEFYILKFILNSAIITEASSSTNNNDNDGGTSFPWWAYVLLGSII